ncbi:hypothetical protein K437DRAFT_296151 [Tilletiaria anomala UBC 951]|uniref:Fe2OG dioxygenase domain-containing protein n=1 Tax=Tilletiaria anomala (strain ATCC 24038 / CBS 436.72 / UBC 951) TaxID=1037660 RepID=A0A066VBW9_TILAU|nr:uncharacterized protein K437DRAFT_296151 [Tilletiaria anomala UBC 951]KDN39242.1 hypothetical protein K437DRAFT_296151 [Tilletiaria anomala UBC 951]
MASQAVFELFESFRLELPESSQPGPSAQPPSNSLDGFFYIPNFISDEEERYLMDKVATAPLPKWKTLQNRSGRELGRLQYWGGQVQRETLIPEPLPSFLTTYPPLIQRIKETTPAFASSKHGEPNHCLVNEYLPGQGIMPHEDGRAYFPCVATISLGSHTLLDMYRWAQNDVPPEGDRGARAREAEPVFSILQERRSLLVTTGAAYHDYLHGIAERHTDAPEHLAKVVNVGRLADKRIERVIHRAAEGNAHESLARQTRLSLTFRDVERVSKGLGALLSKTKR